MLGAGPLSFDMKEPFGHLAMRVRGEAVPTSVDAQIGGALQGHGDPVPIEIDVDLRPAVPPFMNGGLLPDARHISTPRRRGTSWVIRGASSSCAAPPGSSRIAGETHAIDGGANRIRRQSIRRLAKFRGHAWQAALFPSGRGFGYIAYPPRTDGKDTYNEGYVFEGDGELVPARVVRTPWLETLTPSGENVSCVLETNHGTTVEITGETTASTFMVMPPDVGEGLRLQQTIVRYTWDGETAGGMLERSAATNALS